MDRLAAMETFVRVIEAGVVLRRGKAAACRPAGRLENDREIGRSARRAATVALDARPVADRGWSQRRVIGSPSYFMAMGVPQTPADLPAQQVIIYEQRPGGSTSAFRKRATETAVQRQGPTPRQRG